MVNDIELPVIKIVPLDALLLHEEVEARRAEGVASRLREDGVLKNPPVVTPMKGDGYVVLDGANRYTALAALGYRYAAVQVVDYDWDVELGTWSHLLTGIDTGELLEIIRAQFGHALNSDYGVGHLGSREVAACAICPGGRVYTLEGSTNLSGRISRLSRLVNAYTGRVTIHRVKSERLEPLLSHYDDISALVVFARYTPAEILELATHGDKLPAGVTRHVIHRRALHLNLPLELLTGDTGPEEKNAWLNSWIKEKLKRKEIRFYQESIYLFDE